MTILQGDIKLVKSLVMDDVPEGGGAPSSSVVIDGASNEIFSDVSNSDRVVGRVSARKLHLSIQSHDTDTYLGANLIVATPPPDPNVAITIFAGTVFEKRADAMNRLEAYLGVGVNYAGFLYGNHIQGQRSVQILQRTDERPSIGATLVLTKLEGAAGEYKQYVRITEAATALRTFTDANGDYTRYVLSLKISDPLLVDFPGFDAARSEPSKAATSLATKVSESIVTDAAQYQGVVALQEAAAIGDFTIKAETIFSQLVPSAQIETPIADARTNQVSAVPVPAGAAVTRNIAVAVNSNGTGTGYIGGAVVPGSMRATTNWGVIHIDKGGVIYDQANNAPLGTVDYENGIIYYSAGIGTSGVVAPVYTYTPAAVPQSVNQSAGFRVTSENRSLSYVRTMEPPPAPGTLSISYSVAGRWYVLRDDGTGALRGVSSAYGAGVVNFSTGTVQVTLGALPDVGSAIIFQWVESKTAPTTAIDVLSGGFFWPFNTSGAVSVDAGSEAIKPGTLSIAWTSGSTSYLVVDNGLGGLVTSGVNGGTGTVDYAKGVFKLQPAIVPVVGTSMVVSFNRTAKATSTLVLASGAGSLGVTGIKPGSFACVLTGQMRGQYLANPIVNWGPAASYRIADDGVGGLDVLIGTARVHVGTINYAAGTIAITANTVIPTAAAAQLLGFDNVFIASNDALAMFVQS